MVREQLFSFAIAHRRESQKDKLDLSIIFKDEESVVLELETIGKQPLVL
jgi:hypothetical protein